MDYYDKLILWKQGKEECKCISYGDFTEWIFQNLPKTYCKIFYSDIDKIINPWKIHWRINKTDTTEQRLGCGCKIAQPCWKKFWQIRKPWNISGLLVGNEVVWWCGYSWNTWWSLSHQHYWFLYSIVNNPFDYGRIAAANAISDVYAMGGNPTLALAILGFPVDKLSTEVARQIIASAKEICKNAGIPLAGGHTIDSQDPIFGLAVNGLVQKRIFGKKFNSPKRRSYYSDKTYRFWGNVCGF